MAGLIPQQFIDDLLDRIDIVDVIDSRVKLKRTGKNYSACCPFHDEKTPSFTVSPDKQFYYCFGCGASGTALGFVLEYDRVNFPEAVEYLAKLAGVEVPRESQQDAPGDKLRKHLYQLLERADQFFRQQLRQHPARHHATNYLKRRGLSAEIARDFGIGYAPPGWDNLGKALASNSGEEQLLVQCGMLIERPEDGRHYDRFRNRIMFPIRDSRGRVIGFGGRVLDDSKPKYLNSPETPVFHKGQELYGLHEARQACRQLPRLLVVEGYMDVVALAQFGIRYAVATLGTACGEEHLLRAFKHTQEIVFCFDGDNAGRKAAGRALENSLPVMQDGRQIKFLFLPEGEDPDSLVRQIGADKLNHMIDLAVPLEDFLFDSVAGDIDIRSMEGRARFSRRAAPMLHRLPAGVFRELMYDNLAQRTGLTRDTLMELVSLPEESRAAPMPARPAAKQQAQLPPSADYETSTYRTGIDGPNHDAENAVVDVVDEYYASAPEAAAEGYRGPIKLPPARYLCALLLQHPELAPATPAIPAIENSKNPDLRLFVDLLAVLRERPDYNLARILGYWRGKRGEAATRELAHLAATELINEARRRQPFNAHEGYLDCLQRLENKLQKQTRHASIKGLQEKQFNELTEVEKQQLREHYSATMNTNSSKTTPQN